jgi:hypothetical protein
MRHIVENRLDADAAREYAKSQGVEVTINTPPISGVAATPDADTQPILRTAASSAGTVASSDVSELENEYVQRVLETWAAKIIFTESVVVSHDEEEMNWRLFFAHSQDMMGFRADIFTGGWNESNNPINLNYKGLRDRWPESKTMIQSLSALWEDEATRAVLVGLTTGPQSGDVSIAPVMAILRGNAGNAATRTFADTLNELTGANIARKTRKMIRAYIQNSALLVKHEASFIKYLQSIVPDLVLPAQEITEAERAWRRAIIRDFYNVGPALADYLVGDWLLWLWREGQIEWFESYKADSVFL